MVDWCCILLKPYKGLVSTSWSWRLWNLIQLVTLWIHLSDATACAIVLPLWLLLLSPFAPIKANDLAQGTLLCATVVFVAGLFITRDRTTTIGDYMVWSGCCCCFLLYFFVFVNATNKRYAWYRLADNSVFHMCSTRFCLRDPMYRRLTIYLPCTPIHTLTCFRFLSYLRFC